MVSYGSATIPNDLDVCYRRTPENLARIVRALRPLRPRLRGAPADVPFLWDERTLHNGLNFTLVTDLGDVDLLGELAGVGRYESLLPATETLQIENADTRIIGLDDLVRSKRAAGRPKDLIHLAELEEIQKRR